MSVLQDLVRAKVSELGPEEAALFFDVSPLRAKQWRDGSKVISLNAVERCFDPTQFVETKPVEANWEGRQVAVCLPVYREFHPLAMFALLALFDRNKMRCFMQCGDAFVAHSRNALTAQFLDSEAEWSFWMDSDIIPPIGNAGWFNRTSGFALGDKFAGIHTINRLLSHNKSLIGGVYYGRAPGGGKPLYSEAFHDPGEEKWIRSGPHDKVKPTKWVAAGCTLIHRKVFEDIVTKFPHLKGQWWSSSEHDTVLKTSEALQALDGGNTAAAIEALKAGKAASDRNSKLGMGEDVQLCVRAAQVGHQPHVDCAILAAHVGGAVYGTSKPKMM